MNRVSSSALLFVWIGLLGAAPLLAQDIDGACPALVKQALAMVDETCTSVGRNEACYGHTLVTAIDWDGGAVVDFDEPGAMAEIVRVASLATFPMDVKAHVWGVAILALQANLPDTLPGQNVIFVVFGDTQVVNEVQPTDSIPRPPTFTAEATSGVNVRSGPGTGFAAAGGLVAGDVVTVIARNAASDWLQIEFGDTTAWVYAPLLTVDGQIDLLAVVEAGEAAPGSHYTGPMQAFRLTTGLSKPACQEAPGDGLLVQAPQGTTVNFLINGIDVEVGSTALLDVSEEGVLQTSTFDGVVTVTSAGISQTAGPGFLVATTAGNPPTEPKPYDYERVRAAPVQLLPEPVSIPVVVPGNADWVDSGIAVTSGQTYTLTTTGEVRTCLGFSDCQPNGPAGLTGLGTAADQGWPAPMPNGVVSALIGRIGADGEPFVVGDGGTFVADKGGTLQFRINDEPLDNNDGAFIVVVELGQET